MYNLTLCLIRDLLGADVSIQLFNGLLGHLMGRRIIPEI